MSTRFEQIRLALRRAGDDVGCQVWAEAEYGVSVEHLVTLGLARAILQRVPACEDHGCHLLATCDQRVVFAERLPGRAGRKFRLTPLGLRSLDAPDELQARARESEPVQRILAVLEEAGQPISAFALYWRLFEPTLDDDDAPRLSRPSLRFYLDLLGTLGLVVEDPRAATFARVQPTAT